MASLKATELPTSVDEAELRSLFGLELRAIQMPKRNGGENCGYAILDFDSSEAADRAMERLNGYRLPQRKATLKLAPCTKASGRPALSSYQLVVGNLAPNLSDADLYSAFRSMSVDVLGARVPIDKQNGLCKGYGFIRLSSEEAADPLETKSHRSTMAGRMITVRKTFPLDTAANGRVLFISNLDPSITDQWLQTLLGVFGDLDFIHSGNNGGTAFARVGFLDTEPAAAAAALLQNRRQQSGRRMFIRWARPLSTDPQLQFSQRFATPLGADFGDEEREFDRSMMPMPTAAERAERVMGPDLDGADRAHWLNMTMQAPPGMSVGPAPLQEPAAKRARTGGPGGAG
mmetsp:Transcript_3135/g.5521  ORF Transcript_3135/g.5521 Transcript_3135/m.5521 type:complete len:345 (+) Transcript_3135:120-1154(+)